ncbi:MAG: ATP-grasp domain-containing protein [Bacteroidales bacterium]|nr:ATP-grasp domain-containing protein [Bacteroidales bacterium]
MNYVYFSPHFPPNYYHFCVALKKFGATVLGLGDQNYNELRPELKSAFAEYFKVEDMHNYNQLVRAMGYFTWKHGKIQGIDSNNEYWLETEAKLRTDFNIEGIRLHELDIIKQKSQMKKVFQNAGVSVARGRVIDTFDDALEFIQETGYPVVGKPDIGVGAANTYKISNEDELRFFFETKPDMPYIMEDFIKGDIESFDGLTDKCGNLLFYTGHAYDSGVMEVVNNDTHVSYYSFRDIPKDLEEAGRKIIKAFKVKSRFFHFEFFRLHNSGKLVALEVNMRPPGGFTTDMFNYACDFDIYQEWASVVVNNKMTGPFSRKYHVCYVSRKFNKNYVLSHDEVMAKYTSMIIHNDHVPDALAQALGNYAYILRGKELDTVLAAQKDIQQLH